MDFPQIKKLVDLVIKSNIAEIEVSEGNKTVRINNVKNISSIAAPNFAGPFVPMQNTVSNIATPAEANVSASPAAEKVAKHTINAPMVGTVYLSSAPGAKHFVEVGQHVEVGDTLCLIEAMKMFNRIEADKSGTIGSRLVDNAQPVEYGQPLFTIE